MISKNSTLFLIAAVLVVFILAAGCASISVKQD
jgi:hypothetical protein